MIANLNNKQIRNLLASELIGRIGCYTGKKVYVVPISYAYDGNDIYAHTCEGLKTEAMRAYPHVCFEVDDIRNMSNWQSVIAWGKFEELTEEAERKKAIKILFNRTLPVISSVTTHLGTTWPFYEEEPEGIDGIFFRIRLEEITGKFEMSTEFVDTSRVQSVMM
jgi:nitroimidazol reductase NimA-like FMN-containing flavoprotein (pyridoxamine 5'-phosphate oxidase superfamily)